MNPPAGTTIEIDDRLYLAPSSSVPMVSYVHAVDTDARNSDDEMHDSIKAMIGANYCGPVHDVLASTGNAIVVDIGSASGKWIIEMASEFPQAKFYGIDLLPTHRDDMPHNAQNLPINFHERWPFEDGTVDLVHMRQLQYATSSTNYKNLLREAARVLRSGGLLIAGEVGRTYLDNENAVLDVTATLPISARHMATMYSLVREQGLDWSGETISTMVTHTPSIVAPESIVIAIPIGAHKQPPDESRPLSQIGEKMVDVFLDFWSSLRPLYKNKGGSDENWDDAIVEMEQGLMIESDFTFPFYIVWAKKL